MTDVAHRNLVACEKRIVLVSRLLRRLVDREEEEYSLHWLGHLRCSREGTRAVVGGTSHPNRWFFISILRYSFSCATFLEAILVARAPFREGQDRVHRCRGTQRCQIGRASTHSHSARLGLILMEATSEPFVASALRRSIEEEALWADALRGSVTLVQRTSVS